MSWQGENKSVAACLNHLLIPVQHTSIPRKLDDVYERHTILYLTLPFSLLGSGNVDSAAIFDAKGENNWARSQNFKVILPLKDARVFEYIPSWPYVSKVERKIIDLLE
jgi:hypothetical protein